MDFKNRKISILSIAGPLLSGLALFLPFFGFKANRQVQDTPYTIINTLPLILWLGILCLIIVYAISIIQKETIIAYIIAAILIAISFSVLTFGYKQLSIEVNKVSRITIGPGFWLLSLGVLLPLWLQSSKTLLLFIIPAIIFISSGLLSEIGILKEYAIKQKRFLLEMINHLKIAFTSVGIAGALAIPFSIFIHRKKKLTAVILSLTAFFQTIPGLALLGLLIAPLAWVSNQFIFLRNIGIKGIGDTPGIIAVCLYALFPIIQNTIVSLDILSADAVTSGKAMGMSNFQLLTWVKLPLAAPVIMGGVRIALVQAIGNTTLVALAGGSGLGNFVFQGLDQGASDLIMLGVIPILLITFLIETSFQLVERKLTPPGVKK